MTDTNVAFLRRILFVDAATCVASGLLSAEGADLLAPALQLPRELLFESGLALFPIALFIALVGARFARSLPAVGVVIAGNAAWAVASFGLLASGAVSPNALGIAFVVVQALAVLALTALEVRQAVAIHGPGMRVA